MYYKNAFKYFESFSSVKIEDGSSDNSPIIFASNNFKVKEL